MKRQYPQFFDVHTHVQFHAFKEDADLVIQRALDAGIWMVNVGTQQDTSANAIMFAEKFSEGLPAEVLTKAGVYATVGLHPIHTEKSYHDSQELETIQQSADYATIVGVGEAKELMNKGFTSRGEGLDYKYYKKLAAHPKVVAIGECGLDYYRLEEETKEKQKEAFLRQIELSKEMKKPLMIHCRNAFSDLIRILGDKRFALCDMPGIVHFFSGNVEDAKKLLDLGFSFSFGGVITFTRDYDEVVRYIPLDRILLETDAPYVAPVPYRGKRNEPMYVTEVAKKIAELKGKSPEEIAVVTFQNARRIFKI